MLITNLGSYAAILGKRWMNAQHISLDISNNTIKFPEDPIVSIDSAKPTKPPPVKLLSRPSASITQDKIGSMNIINAAGYGLLAKNCKKDKTELLALSIEDIDRKLLYHENLRIAALEVFTVEETELVREQIKEKLPREYYNLINIFDRSEANKLPPYRPSDHKIELNGQSSPPQSRAYKMSPFKLLKVKEYLTENLSKGFITPSKAAYSSSVLFAQKANGDLRFCVDYRKLNALTKRNRYPLPLIDEIIGKIRGCKYLTRLDIIAAFNKIRMDSESEDLTT